MVSKTPYFLMAFYDILQEVEAIPVGEGEYTH